MKTVKGVGAVGSCSDAMDFRPVGPLTYVGDCCANGVEGVPGMILRRRRWIGDVGDAGGCTLRLGCRVLLTLVNQHPQAHS